MSTGAATARTHSGVQCESFFSELLRRHGFLLLMLPALLLLGAVYGVPIFRLLATSFGANEWSLDSYKVALTDRYMWKVLLSTLRLSAEVTAFCLLLGYPVAYLMIRSGPRWTQVLTILVVLPMWTSVLVRSYAWIVVLGRNGIVNQLLADGGLISEPLTLLYNRFGVYVAWFILCCLI